MVSSQATSVAAYLDELPADRRAVITGALAHVRRAVPAGYAEIMQHGMIAWVVPREVYPDTYNGQPLLFAALASQKNNVSLYLSCVYASDDGRAAFERDYQAAGKKLDMGKSCLRFRALDDVAWPVVERSLAGLDVTSYVALAKAAHAATKTGQRKAKAAAKKATPERLAAKRPATKRKPS